MADFADAIRYRGLLGHGTSVPRLSSIEPPWVGGVRVYSGGLRTRVKYEFPVFKPMTKTLKAS